MFTLIRHYTMYTHIKTSHGTSMNIYKFYVSVKIFKKLLREERTKSIGEIITQKIPQSMLCLLKSALLGTSHQFRFFF